MASASVNDVWITTSTALMAVDAAGASKVSLSVTTQVAAQSASDLTVQIEGSNDGGTWFLIDTAENAGDVGSKGFSRDIGGFALVRAYFTRGGNADPLISASLNTGN